MVKVIEYGGGHRCHDQLPHPYTKAHLRTAGKIANMYTRGTIVECNCGKRYKMVQGIFRHWKRIKS